MIRLFNILSMMILATTLYSQDLQLTQFYASPLYLNPAFTGANADSRLATSYRNQWAELPGTYKSFLISYDYFVNNIKSGLGIIAISDKSGTQGLSNNLLALSYAYDFKLSRSLSISMGARAGYAWRSLNFNKLLFGDQIARNTPTSLQTPVPEKVNFFDVSAGALLFTSNDWIGIAFDHINNPNESFLDNNAKRPLKGSIHGGMNFPIGSSRGEGAKENKPVIITTFQYRFQNKYDQFDLGLYYKKPKYFAGIWYRGLPGIKAYKPGYQNNDCIAILIGAIYKKDLMLGYSYDLTISYLGFKTTKGSHEISLVYSIINPKKAKKHRPKIVPCPRF